MSDAVTRIEFNELRLDVSEIKDTMNNHVLTTLAAHGECLEELGERVDGLGERLEGLEAELHLVKDGVDAIKGHFGI